MDTAIIGRVAESGLAILDRGGLPALSARRLALEAGTSTMAIYTHFGSMAAVVAAMKGRLLAKFAALLAAVPRTDDPVADLFAMGSTYHRFALASPRQYQLMFGALQLETSSRDSSSPDQMKYAETSDGPFQMLRTAVRRMIAAGRIRDDDDAALAGRIWSICHGATMLQIAGFFGSDDHSPPEIIAHIFVDVLVAMGDARELAYRSSAAAHSSSPVRFDSAESPTEGSQIDDLEDQIQS